jgi:hypothetical protein
MTFQSAISFKELFGLNYNVNCIRRHEVNYRDDSKTSMTSTAIASAKWTDEFLPEKLHEC